jgi:multiple sugar transport system substrate-binding protein
MTAWSRNTLKGALIGAAAIALSVGAAGAEEWSFASAAKPYAGQTIRVLDEITPLQETLSKIVPDFEKETGIKVEWELLNHFEVINKGQADFLSGRGHYDAVMMHGFQLGPMLAADTIRPIDDLMANPALVDPNLDIADFIQSTYTTTAFSGGKQYGLINWNYNQVYWARADLFNNAEEQAAFKAKYGYDLAPAKTLEEMRDIAEFFTRKKGENLAGKPLESDFYGIVLEGIKGGTTFTSMWRNFIQNYGGDIVDKDGKPSIDSPEAIKGITAWADLWKFGPPGMAEYSLVDVPTVMGNGIAAQTIAWSDFVLGIDKPGASPLAGQFLYAPVPLAKGMTKRHTEAEPSVTVIAKTSKNPEATFLFLQWLVSKKQQDALIALGEGGVPVRESSWALPVMQGGALKDLFVAMKESIATSEAKPKMPKYYELFDMWNGVAQDIGLGTISPADGAKKMQSEMLKICEKCLL